MKPLKPRITTRITTRNTTRNTMTLVAAGIVLIACFSVVITVAGAASSPPRATPKPPPKEQPSLAVAVTRLQPAVFSNRVTANGNVMPWQEASIGAEVNGLRLTDVRVNVGDKVRRGQLLAVFAAETVTEELAQSRAAVAEAEATLVEAAATARRARVLQDSGALSAQQILQHLTAERAAQARLDSAQATQRLQQLRLAQTRVVAPDNGIISGRTATVGAVVSAGQELFRLIRAERLEWRAEVAAADFVRLRPGQKVRVMPSGGDAIEGRLRVLGPVIDIQTRNGVAYVDLLPSASSASSAGNVSGVSGVSTHAGMFARGEFELGSSQGMALPKGAVQWREGFGYVMRVGLDARVVATKVVVGRRSGDLVEVLGGLAAQDRVVATGAAFLGHGDLVQVVETP